MALNEAHPIDPPLLARLAGHRAVWDERARLAAMLDDAPYGILWRDGDRISANRTARALLGFAPQHLDDLLAALSEADRTRLQHSLKSDAPDPVDIALGDRTLRIRPADPALWLEDVTALFAERRAKQESEALASLRAAKLDCFSMPVWQRGPDQRLLWCNAAYAAALDLTCEAVIEHQRDFTTDRGDDSARALARKALETKSGETQERHVVIGGDRRLFRIVETALPDDLGTVGFAVDITDREAVEHDLGRQIDSQARLLEQLNTGISIYGTDTRLQFYNSTWATMFGIEPAFADSKPPLPEVLDRMHERRKLPEQPDFRRFKQERLGLFTTLIDSHEEMLHRLDGSTLRMLAVPYPLGGIMFISEDVTDRIQLKSEYNTMMAVQHATLNNLLESIAVIGTDGRVKLCNVHFDKLWKLDPEAMRREPHIADITEQMRPLLLADDAAEEQWQELRETLTRQVFGRETATIRLECVDGRTFERTVVPLPDGNKLITHLEITDTLRIEQALRDRNKALEEAERLKTEFLANTSYQLRTPLNAISGFAEILSNEYFGQLNDRQKDYTRDIIDASDRLMSLIDTILDLSTIEAGYMELDFTEIDLSALFEQIETLATEWARKQSIEITLSCPPELGVLTADAQRVRQILMNLIGNALKYTGSGGRIAVTAEADHARDTISLIVADNGVGIAAEDQQRVQNAFERVPHGRDDKGAGLGLTLVKSFVELHGGRLLIESAPGAGTTVRCILPRCPKPRTETIKQVEQAPGHGPTA